MFSLVYEAVPLSSGDCCLIVLEDVGFSENTFGCDRLHHAVRCKNPRSGIKVSWRRLPIEGESTRTMAHKTTFCGCSVIALESVLGCQIIKGTSIEVSCNLIRKKAILEGLKELKVVGDTPCYLHGYDTCMWCVKTNLVI